MRGIVSYIVQRYTKENNKYMNLYDKEKQSRHIIYLDANNLNGWAMTQYLPTGGFKWLIQDEVKILDVNMIQKGNPDGFILEVVYYSEELHDLHTDYPLALEKIMIKEII